mmetsp:Transcript_21775/g.56772  ORF Transcript_21775/g.56772 Transcript_21775/m.56772 type:complete len:471 (-) Transcript_21775:86-1498(-)
MASPATNVVEYSFQEGVPITGIWDINPNPQGPIATPHDGYLSYTITHALASNQWLTNYISDTFDTLAPGPSELSQRNAGCNLVFKVRVNTIEDTGEVKFELSAGVILRFTSNGAVAQYQYWEPVGGGFVTLGASKIQADGEWHNIVMVINPNHVYVLEDDDIAFSWTAAAVGSIFRPEFSMQCLDVGASMSIDLGNVVVMPPALHLSTSSTFDYVFTTSKPPPTELIKFRVDPGLQVKFSNGYARFFGLPMVGLNKWAFLDVVHPGQMHNVFTYWIRVNSSQGYETKITLPGGNILRLLDGGQTANWCLFNAAGLFEILAPSSIHAAIPPSGLEFTSVTLVTSGSTMYLLESGVCLYKRTYSPPASAGWSAGLSLQHYDSNDVSVSVGGIRTVPSTKLVGSTPKGCSTLTEMEMDLVEKCALHLASDSISLAKQQLRVPEQRCRRVPWWLLASGTLLAIALMGMAVLIWF